MGQGPSGEAPPQTSPASENVAALAAATLTRTVDEARSDYKALEGIESQSLDRLLHRKSTYAGVRRLIRGRAPSQFKVTHVPGHVDPSTCTDAEERFNALGNDAADRVAKASLDRYSKPSDREFFEWNQEVSFLQKR